MSCSSSSRLLLPRCAPASGVFAAVERDTRALALSDAERFNYYPATPLAVVSWIFEGALHPVQMVGTATGEPALSAPLPRLTLAGPQRRPRASWAPAGACLVGGVSSGRPGAADWRARHGADGRHRTLAEVASRAFLDACLSVFEGSDAGPFARVENALAPLWRDARPAAPAPFLGEWLRGLAGRAVLSGAGQGLRQVQRRIRPGPARVIAICNGIRGSRMRWRACPRIAGTAESTGPGWPAARASPTSRTWAAKCAA